MDWKRLGQTVQKVDATVDRVEWTLWRWTLVLVVPLALLWAAVDAVRLLGGFVAPGPAAEDVKANIAIRGIGGLVLGLIWYVGFHRRRRR